MWYLVSDIVSGEPVSKEAAQLQVFEDQPEYDAKIEGLITAARAHVEAYCNRQFAAHAMVWECDSFADFARLPAAPAVSVTSISYVDPDGEVLTLPTERYVLRGQTHNPMIIPAPGEVWPQIARGSVITLTASFGGNCPPDVTNAMLLLIGDGFTVSENAARPAWTTVDALLTNHRRGAWS